MDTYDEIIAASKIRRKSGWKSPLYSIDKVKPSQVDPSDLVIKRPFHIKIGSGRPRSSLFGSLKEIGDRGEEIVYRWLCDTLKPADCETVDWLAQRGETPGWHITYMSTAGEQISVEVKATT